MSTQRPIQNSDLHLVRQVRQTHLTPQAQSEILADDLRPADTTCIRPMHPVRPDCPWDVFSHPMRPTKVLILRLRPEASDANQPPWDKTGAPRGYTRPQIYRKRPDELPLLGVRPLGDYYLFFIYPLQSSKFPTLQAKISRRYSILI